MALSHKPINKGTYIKTNIQDFDVSLQKVSNIRSQFLVHKLRLLTSKTYPNIARIDQFVRDLYPRQIFRLTDRQTLNFHKATKLTMVPQ